MHRNALTRLHIAMVIVMALMVIIGARTSVAQERGILVPRPQSEMTIAELSEEVYDEVKSLHAFEAMPLPNSPERRRTLEIRLDEKTINLLKNIMALSQRVLAKSEDAPERETLRQLVQSRGIEIEQTLILRFSSLTERLNQSLARQASLSGAALLSEESLGELLDGQRLQYLSLASDLTLLMKTLELEETDLRKKVISTLTYFGDEMMGLVHLHRHGLSMLSARSASDGTDADLLQAARFESERLELATKRLRKVVTQLELLGGDTLEMRRTLIEERRGLALTLVDTAVINVLYAEISSEIRDWLSVRGIGAAISFVLFVVIVIISRALSRIAKRLAARALRNAEESVSQLLRETLISMAGTVVFLIGLLVALSQIGISVTPLIAGLGVIGFIVGFALQDTLANFASGAMILAYRPFDTGDFISAADVEGEVRKMNLVNTTIVTVDNRVLIIPNSKIWGGVIMNFTGQHLRRTDVIYGVSYSEDLDHVQRVLEELIAADERFLTTPPAIVRVKHFGDSSIDFMVRAYVRTEQFWETLWALNKSVKQRFDAEGISIPFPQRDVHMLSTSEPPAGRQGEESS
ncbi:MAG: mechanosensitive ion channel family protein [Halieaceae bacterium]|nr:mechanosensitive ion channel family protein [Halieaceae bacterium]